MKNPMIEEAIDEEIEITEFLHKPKGRKYYAWAVEGKSTIVYLRAIVKEGDIRIYATPRVNQRYETGELFVLSRMTRKLMERTEYPFWVINAIGEGQVLRFDKERREINDGRKEAGIVDPAKSTGR